MNSLTHRQDPVELWRAGMQALELLGIGWLVCDADGRVLGANRIASRILETRDGLRLNSKGALATTRGRPDLLAEAVQRAAMGSVSKKQKNRGTALTVSRTLGKGSLALWVRPVGATSTTAGSALSAALVLIVDPSLSVPTTETHLRQLHGFTAREACLARLLMDGSTLDHSCRELRISRSTACTHLRRLFKKAHVRRQSELVSVLLKTVGLVRLREESGDGPRETRVRLIDRAVVWPRRLPSELLAVGR